jgi:hypothetical protein
MLPGGFPSQYGLPASTARQKSKSSKSSAKHLARMVERMTSSLPISTGDEDGAGAGDAAYEPFTGFGPGGGWPGGGYQDQFAPAPVPASAAGDDIARRLDRVVDLLEKRHGGGGGARQTTQDVLLYAATGIFMIFLFDKFVDLGARYRL